MILFVTFYLFNVRLIFSYTVCTTVPVISISSKLYINKNWNFNIILADFNIFGLDCHQGICILVIYACP